MSSSSSRATGQAPPHWPALEMMDGRLRNPKEIVEQTVVAKARENQALHEVYGEKSVTYGPFLSHLYDALTCRFVKVCLGGQAAMSCSPAIRGAIATVWRPKRLVSSIGRISSTGTVCWKATNWTSCLRATWRRKALQARLAEHFEGKRNHRLLIWSLLSFEWLQRHFIDGNLSGEHV